MNSFIWYGGMMTGFMSEVGDGLLYPPYWSQNEVNTVLQV